MSEWTHIEFYPEVKWIGTHRLDPRPGLFGKVLDYFWPRFVPIPGGGRFYVKGDDGRWLTSIDGIMWELPDQGDTA